MNFQTEFAFHVAHVCSLHSVQVRKGGRTGNLKVPYIIHPLQVIQKLRRWEIDANNHLTKSIWIAALYHDIVEDVTHLSAKELVPLIGPENATIVDELTLVGDSKEDKQAYLESFSKKSVLSLIIKAADRVCNVEDYLQDEPKYAPKYIKKGDVLFKIIYSREGEMISAIGEKSTSLLISNVKYIHSLGKA